jgi:hypothetical protein
MTSVQALATNPRAVQLIGSQAHFPSVVQISRVQLLLSLQASSAFCKVHSGEVGGQIVMVWHAPRVMLHSRLVQTGSFGVPQSMVLLIMHFPEVELPALSSHLYVWQGSFFCSALQVTGAVEQHTDPLFNTPGWQGLGEAQVSGGRQEPQTQKPQQPPQGATFSSQARAINSRLFEASSAKLFRRITRSG